MKRLFVVAAIGLLSVACSTAEPNAGQEVVLVQKPMFFGSGGVDPTPVKTGLVYIALTTDAIPVNMQPRKQEISFDDLFTSDGVPLDFHATVQYQVTDSVKLVRDFGADDGPHGMGFFLRVIDAPLRSAARDAVKKHGLSKWTTR
jgi:regulator of protease activity HflC (stomatin/prohibitin superfamily)